MHGSIGGIYQAKQTQLLLAHPLVVVLQVEIEMRLEPFIAARELCECLPAGDDIDQILRLETSDALVGEVEGGDFGR